jgi:glucan phosphoethanolaminetransferase (alkaline phosphatase superfamily)
MQNGLSHKLVSVFLYLILAISVVILGYFYYVASGVTVTSDTPFETQLAEYGSIIDVFIIWAYILIIIAAAAAVIPAVIQMVTQPKNAVKSVLSIVLLGAVVLIAYLMSDGTPFTTEQMPGYEGSDNIPSKMILGDTMLFTMYFLLAGGVISIIYAEVAKVFK